MNRELKFRAWSIGHKKMHYKVNLYSLNGNEMTKSQLDNKSFMDTIGGSCEIMQFTGLTDRNGKEIYDGDRVKRRIFLESGSDYIDYIYDVKWNGWCYALFIADKQMHGLDPINAKEVEVIGNVFETTELLNKQP